MGEDDMRRKRQDLFQAKLQRQKRLEQRQTETRSLIRQLQTELQSIDTELDSIRQSNLSWKATVFRILQDTKHENGEHGRCTLFGKCEECWRRSDNVSFETAGCNAATCSCTCHATQETDTSDDSEDSGSECEMASADSITDRIEEFCEEIDSHKDTNPLKFLTAIEKLETMGEFAGQMAWINEEYCGMICAKWVRLCCVVPLCVARLTLCVYICTAASGVEVRRK